MGQAIRSRIEGQLYDRFTRLGVKFEFIVKPAGNRVPRLHLTVGKGWRLVGPLFRECLRHPNIEFSWATRAESLIVRNGAVRAFAWFSRERERSATYMPGT